MVSNVRENNEPNVKSELTSSRNIFIGEENPVDILPSFLFRLVGV
jgi:hypothetical protein